MFLFWSSSRAAGGHHGLFSAGHHYRSQCSLSSDFALLGWDQLRRWGRDTAFALPAPPPQHTLKNSLGCGQEIKGGWGQIWCGEYGDFKVTLLPRGWTGQEGSHRSSSVRRCWGWSRRWQDHTAAVLHSKRYWAALGQVAHETVPLDRRPSGDRGHWTATWWRKRTGNSGAEGAYVSRWRHSAAG